MSEDIASRALRLVGTPFVHQGRLPGVAMDCLGVVVVAVGAQANDERDYHRMPDAGRLRRMLDYYFEREPATTLVDAPIGSVIAFAFGRARKVRHLGVRTRDGFVHATEERVVEQAIAPPWASYFEGAYRWRA